VVRLASGELCPELGHQRFKAVGGVWWKPHKLAQGSSLQRGGEHSAHDCVVRGVQAHMDGVHVHVFIWIGRTVVTVHVQAFPHNRQLFPHHIVSEWLSAGQV